MRRPIRAELRKLRTTRTFLGLLAATLVLVSLATILTLALSSDLGGESDVRSVLSSAGLSGLLVLVLGVVASAGEYRHGTIAATLLFTPSRLRVLLAQASASALAGAAIGVAAAAVTAAIGLPWLAAKDVSLQLSTGQVVGLFLGGVLYTALAGALGVAVGGLLRNQVAAVVAVLLIILVVDPVLGALIADYAKYSLGGLGVAMSGGPPENVGGDPGQLPPFWLAALLWAAYTLALIAVAAALTARRDI